MFGVGGCVFTIRHFDTVLEAFSALGPINVTNQSIGLKKTFLLDHYISRYCPSPRCLEDEGVDAAAVVVDDLQRLLVALHEAVVDEDRPALVVALPVVPEDLTHLETASGGLVEG